MAIPETPALVEIEDCRGVLRVFSDGSVVRSSQPCFRVSVEDDGSVIWKDIVFDSVHSLELRVYKPTDTGGTKLPVFYYYHGGGFCMGSRTWPNCHNYCLRLSSQLRAVVVAPDYRLGPENRLPAAIEDSISSVRWLYSQAVSIEPDTWLTDVADFSRVYISGSSAGGNIAHHLAVWFNAEDLTPVCVRGYVLLMPFFGGAVHSKSEAECPVDAFLGLELNDRFWRLSLPVGATRDHPLSNPFGPASENLEPVALGPTLAVVGGCDLLRDRTVDYAKQLKEWGKPVELLEFKGKQHGFFSVEPVSDAAEELMQKIVRFMADNSGVC